MNPLLPLRDLRNLRGESLRAKRIPALSLCLCAKIRSSAKSQREAKSCPTAVCSPCHSAAQMVGEIGLMGERIWARWPWNWRCRLRQSRGGWTHAPGWPRISTALGVMFGNSHWAQKWHRVGMEWVYRRPNRTGQRQTLRANLRCEYRPQ